VGLNDSLPDKDYVGVVSRDFLYVEERGASEVEFYDLRVDPGAQQDLGAEHPQAARHRAHVEPTTPGWDPPGAGPGQHEIDAETRRELETLGYLSDGD
jgi:hypothetical protein